MRSIVNKLLAFAVITVVASLYLDRYAAPVGEVDAETVIKAPAHEVWPYLNDFEKWGEWQVGVSEVTPVSGNHAYKNARFSCALTLMGKRRQLEGKVLDVTHSGIQLELRGKGFNIVQTYVVVDDDTHTKLQQSWRMEYTNLMYKVMSPLLTRSAKSVASASGSQLTTLVRQAADPALLSGLQ